MIWEASFKEKGQNYKYKIRSKSIYLKWENKPQITNFEKIDNYQTYAKSRKVRYAN